MRREKYMYYWEKEVKLLYDESSLTSSIHSKYRPLYTISKKEKEDFYIYGIPLVNFNSSYRLKNYNDILGALKGVRNQNMLFSPKNGSYLISIGKGCIIEKDEGILLLFVTGIEGLPEQDRLFISYNFFDPKYSILYKKVYEEIIELALKEGVPMEVLSSDVIKTMVFKPILRPFDSFKTIKEYNEYVDNQLDLEYLYEEKVLKPVERNADSISPIVQTTALKLIGAFIAVDDLDIITREILDLCNQPENYFKPTEDIIGDYMKNIDYSRFTLIEMIASDNIFGIPTRFA